MPKYDGLNKFNYDRLHPDKIAFEDRIQSDVIVLTPHAEYYILCYVQHSGNCVGGSLHDVVPVHPNCSHIPWVRETDEHRRLMKGKVADMIKDGLLSEFVAFKPTHSHNALRCTPRGWAYVMKQHNNTRFSYEP